MMIIVEMELKSAVSESRDHNLCRVEIANVSDHGRYADYRVRLFARNHGRLIKERTIIGWPKKDRPAWRLLAEAMKRLETPQ